MVRVNFHIHSTGSDGKVSPEEIIQKSIEAGLTHICFTDHYPRPTNDEWTKKFHSKEYTEEIKKLKEKYKDKIDISFGAEFDWFEEHKDKISQLIKNEKFDYILGSIHFLKMKSGQDGPIYYNKGLFEDLIKDFGSIESVIREYYKQIRLLVNSKLYDAVAHLELIKAFYENPSFLNEKWYKEEVEKTLDEIRKNKTGIEINMSGVRRTVKEPFPSIYVLR
jgi:histidinol-phosphatase (PHP family)